MRPATTLTLGLLLAVILVAGIVALAYLRLASPAYLQMIEIGPLFQETQVAVVKALIHTRDWSRPRIGKHLRPLALLHGLAARQRGNGALLGGIRDGLAAIRLGLLGR